MSDPYYMEKDLLNQNSGFHMKKNRPSLPVLETGPNLNFENEIDMNIDDNLLQSTFTNTGSFPLNSGDDEIEEDWDSEIYADRSVGGLSDKSPISFSLASLIDQNQDVQHESLLEYLEKSFDKRRNINSQHSLPSLDSRNEDIPDPLYLQGLKDWVSSASSFFEKHLEYGKKNPNLPIFIPPISSQQAAPLISEIHSFLDSMMAKIAEKDIGAIEAAFPELEALIFWIRWQLQLPDESRSSTNPNASGGNNVSTTGTAASNNSNVSMSDDMISSLVLSRLSFKSLVKLSEKMFPVVTSLLTQYVLPPWAVSLIPTTLPSASSASLINGSSEANASPKKDNNSRRFEPNSNEFSFATGNSTVDWLNENDLACSWSLSMSFLRASVIFNEILGHIVASLPAHRLPRHYIPKEEGLMGPLTLGLVQAIFFLGRKSLLSPENGMIGSDGSIYSSTSSEASTGIGATHLVPEHAWMMSWSEYFLTVSAPSIIQASNLSLSFFPPFLGFPSSSSFASFCPTLPLAPSMSTASSSFGNSPSGNLPFLLDLYALILSDELLSLCGLSPLTGQKFPKKKSNVLNSANNFNTSSSGSVHSGNVSVANSENSWGSRSMQSFYSDSSVGSFESQNDGHSIASNGSSSFNNSTSNSSRRSAGGGSNMMGEDIDKSLESQELTSRLAWMRVALHVVERSIELVAILPSSHILRSRLCFTACKYLESLCRGSFSWQSKSLFPSVVRSIVETERSLLDYYERAFGTSEEIRLSQLLMFEAAADMFPENFMPPISPNVQEHYVFCDPSQNPSPTASLGFQPSSSGDSSVEVWIPLSWSLSLVPEPIGGLPPSLSNRSTSSSTSLNSWKLLRFMGAIGPIRYAQVESDLFGSLVLRGLSQSVIEASSANAILLMSLQIHLHHRLHNGKALAKIRKEVTLLGVKNNQAETACLHGRFVLEDLAKSEEFQELVVMTDLLVDQYNSLGRFEHAIVLLHFSIAVLTKASLNFASITGATTISSTASANVPSTSSSVSQMTSAFFSSIAGHSSGPPQNVASASGQNTSGSSASNSTSNGNSSSNWNLAQRNLLADPLRLRLAQAFLSHGQPAEAVLVLQQLFLLLSSRGDSLVLINKKIAVLTWLVKAYLDLESHETCKKIIVTIKNLRMMRAAQLASNNPSIPTMRPGGNGNWVGVEGFGNSVGGFSDASMNGNQTSWGIMSIPLPPSPAAANHDGRKKSSKSHGGSNAPQPSTSQIHGQAGPGGVSGLFGDQFDSFLPKYCLSSHNADLGEMISRVYFQANNFVSALKSLTPTIIGVELSVSSAMNPQSLNIQGSRQGSSRLPSSNSAVTRPALLELAKLYMLRGEIQLEASRSSAKVKFPFVVGSAQLFTAVFVLFDAESHSQSLSSNSSTPTSYHTSHSSEQRRRANGNYPSVNISQPITSPGGSTSFLTCKRSRRYACPADLLFDACVWFRRALSLYRLVSEEIGAVKAANALASCHLEALFVPSLFFNVPFDVAQNLGPGLSDESSSGERFSQSQNGSQPGFKRDSHNSNGIGSAPSFRPNYGPNHTSNASRSSASRDGSQSSRFGSGDRHVSLQEAASIMTFALNTSIECSLPMHMLESYLNMAELKLLLGENFEAVAFWWEARDLFMHLYVNGTQIPLARRAPLPFLRRISTFLNRLVRILWACDKPLINQNLVLLDIHVIFSHELDRMLRNVMSLSRQVSRSLDGILHQVHSLANPAGMATHPGSPTGMGMGGSFGNSMNPSFSSPTNSSTTSNAQNSYFEIQSSYPDSTLSSFILAMNTLLSSDNSGISFSLLLDPDNPSQFKPMMEACVLDRVFNFRKDFRVDDSGVGIKNGSSSSASSITTVRMEEAFAEEESYHVNTQDFFPWAIKNPATESENSCDYEAEFISNCWRCVSLLQAAEDKMASSAQSIRAVRKQARFILKSMSLLMRRLRNADLQWGSMELSYEEVIRSFSSDNNTYSNGGYFNANQLSSRVSNPPGLSNSSSSNFRYQEMVSGVPEGDPKKAVLLFERCQHVMYCIQIDNLLMMYRPSSGAAYVQLFGGVDFVTYAEASLALQPSALTSSNVNNISSSVGGVGNNRFQTKNDNTVNTNSYGYDDNIGVYGANNSFPNNHNGTQFGNWHDSHRPDGMDSEISSDWNDYNRMQGNSYPQQQSRFQGSSSTFDVLGANNGRSMTYGSNPNPQPNFPGVVGSSNSWNYSSHGDLPPPPPSSSMFSSSSRIFYPQPPNPGQINGSNGPYGQSGQQQHGRGSATYVSAGSQSTLSHQSIQLPEAGLPNQDSQFLFDIAIESQESSLGGGSTARRQRIDSMKEGVLKGALAFLKGLDTDYLTELSSSSASFGKKPLPVDDSLRYKALLPAGLLKIFKVQRSDPSPPFCPIPLTVLASKNLHIIPWEILSEIRVVRQISFTHMLFHGKSGLQGRGIVGPGWFQTPIYLGAAQGLMGLPTRLASDIKSRDLLRRASGILRSFHLLHHSVSSIVKASRNILALPSPSRSQMSNEALKKYTGICEGYQDRMWPSPSPLLPLGKTSSQSLRSRRLRKFTFFDLGSHERDARALTEWLGQACAPIPSQGFSSFPLLLLAYSDLYELGEIILHVLSNRGDAVLVFAPQCYIGAVAKELVRSVDTWCSAHALGNNGVATNPTTTTTTTTSSSSSTFTNNMGASQPNAANNSLSSVGVIGSSFSSLNLSGTLDSSSSSQYSSSSFPSNGGAGAAFGPVFSSEHEKLDPDFASKTWVYHAVMDAVVRIQEESNLPLAVFI